MRFMKKQKHINQGIIQRRDRRESKKKRKKKRKIREREREREQRGDEDRQEGKSKEKGKRNKLSIFKRRKERHTLFHYQSPQQEASTCFFTYFYYYFLFPFSFFFFLSFFFFFLFLFSFFFFIFFPSLSHLHNGANHQLMGSPKGANTSNAVQASAYQHDLQIHPPSRLQKRRP